MRYLRMTMPKPSEIIDLTKGDRADQELVISKLLDEMAEDITKIKQVVTSLVLKGVEDKQDMTVFKEREWDNET